MTTEDTPLIPPKSASTVRERVPCPIDPSHTVYKDLLYRHVKICNAATHERGLRKSAFYENDVNLLPEEFSRASGASSIHRRSSSQGPVTELIDTDVESFMTTYLRQKAASEKSNESKECARHCGSNSGTGAATMKALEGVSREEFDDLIRRVDEAFEKCCFIVDEEADEIQLNRDSMTVAVETCVLRPDVCKDMFQEYEGATQKMKHIRQQASIIGHVERHGLLESQNTFVEWGSGRGELSLMLLQALLVKICPSDMTVESARDVPRPDFLLIDRAAQRRKMDTKMKMALVEVLRQKVAKGEIEGLLQESSPQNVASTTATHVPVPEPGGCDGAVVQQVPKKTKGKRVPYRRGQYAFERDASLHVTVERLLIDIKDLVFDKVPLVRPFFEKSAAAEPEEDKKIVNISKHLCGVATDLTLRCLNSVGCQDHKIRSPRQSPPAQIGGVFIALCCHHRCEWDSYCNQKFFTDLGFDANDFDKIRMLTTWAICYTDDVIKKRNDDEHYHTFGRNIHEKITIGRKCKRLIDAGRAHYLRQYGGYGHVRLVRYVEESATPENCMLVAVPREECR